MLLTPQLPASPAFNRLQGGQNMNLAPWLIPSVAAPNQNRLINAGGTGNLLVDAATPVSLAPPPIDRHRHMRGGPPR
jgi:hypothetical protein